MNNESTIVQTIERIYKLASEIEEQDAVLNDRLVGVLCDPGPVEAGVEGNNAPGGSSCPIDARLRGIESQLRDISSAKTDILNRLQL